MYLPHIKHIQSGDYTKSDPQLKAVYEVYFALPAPIASAFSEDALTLTQQVFSVAGLDALQKTAAASSQQFFGVDVSYLNPSLDNTYADIQITFNLNLRNGNDAWVLKILKAWAKLGYDLSDGTRTLRKDYTSENLQISEGARNGDVWRTVHFRNVILTNLTGLDDLNYKTNEAAQIQATFRCDWWDEQLA